MELDFQNFKVQDIKTVGNHKVVNPPHKINFNCENFWIIGEIGRGKTTFFDKIYHFFCFNEKATSPIQDLTTNLTIKLKNKESYNIVFNTYSKEKITVLRLDDYNESESSNILKKKGIIDNNLLKLNFISQNMQDDAIYNSNLKVSNFFELNKEYFLDERENRILNRFSEIIKEQTKLYKNLINQKFQINHTILNLSREIEKNEETLDNIQLFIENIEKIKDYINNLKVDNELRELYVKKKNIESEIFGQKSKLKKLNQIKKFGQEYSTRKKDDTFLRSLYVNYEPICPICSNFVSFNKFKTRYNSKNCYLCGDSSYDYIEQEESISDEKSNEKPKLANIKSLQYFLNKKINELKREKENIDKEINKFKQFTQPIDQDLKEIINNNYLDLTRPRFSLDEEFNRKVELKNHYSELIQNQKELLNNHQKKLEVLQKNEKLTRYVREILNKNYESLKEKFEENIQAIFKNFIKDLRYYWSKLTNESIKTIIYNKNEDILKIAAVSTTGTRFFFNITSLRLTDQRHFSQGQSNALRFAIHFSIIKNLYEKFQKFPLKTIIIDEPPLGIKKELFNVIKEDLIPKLDFQFIILSTEKEELFLEWKEDNFKPYDRFYSTKSSQLQKLISEFW